VREALNYAFDFEELSNTQFFGQYDRIDSYFYGLRTFRSRPAGGRRARNPQFR
jgi:ABC-type oligopeptide transport system substrate-binding subunit